MSKRKRTRAQIAADKLRTGRPRKAKGEKQSKRIGVSATPSEYEYFQELACKEGVSLAAIVMRPWREKED